MKRTKTRRTEAELRMQAVEGVTNPYYCSPWRLPGETLAEEMCRKFEADDLEEERRLTESDSDWLSEREEARLLGY